MSRGKNKEIYYAYWFPTVYRIVASSPFFPNILLLRLLSHATHSQLLMIFSQMESVYPQARPDKHQPEGVLQTPSFGEKDWLSRVNLERKILPLRGYNFSILILPGLGNEGFPKSKRESSAFRRITCIHRVRTNFWIQNSWLFPDYFQNNSLFSQTQGYQIIMWSKETLKNAGTKLFFRMHCKLTVTTVQCRHKRIMKLIHSVIVVATGKIEWDLTTEKIHLLSTCCNVEKENKKNPDFLPFFKTLSLFSRLLSGLLCKFQRIFTNSRLCINPVYICYRSKLNSG